VNGLGPSAYLGAGAFVESKLVLTEGASIGNIESKLTLLLGLSCHREAPRGISLILYMNEARHNSWLNGLQGRSEQPSKFRTICAFLMEVVPTVPQLPTWSL
jgi:hypothetical protein